VIIHKSHTGYLVNNMEFHFLKQTPAFYWLTDLLFFSSCQRTKMWRKKRSWCGVQWDKEEEIIVTSRDPLCPSPDVIYAIIDEYGTHNLNRAQHLFYRIIVLIMINDGDEACRFLLENLWRVCMWVCVFKLLGGCSMPKRFYFMMIIM